MRPIHAHACRAGWARGAAAAGHAPREVPADTKISLPGRARWRTSRRTASTLQGSCECHSRTQLPGPAHRIRAHPNASMVHEPGPHHARQAGVGQSTLHVTPSLLAFPWVAATTPICRTLSCGLTAPVKLNVIKTACSKSSDILLMLLLAVPAGPTECL